MTIAPFSNFGNIQGAGTQTGGSILGTGGLAGLFAALLGGQSAEGIDGLSLSANASGNPFSEFVENIDMEKVGNLGETLKMFLPQGEEGLSGVSSKGLMAALSEFTGSGEIAGDNLESLLSDVESGDVIIYQKVVIEIQKVAVSIQSSGIDLSGIDSLDQLAKSFESMGMAPAEAQEKAERIDDAIKMMKRRLGIETEESKNETSTLASVLYNMVSGQGLVDLKAQTSTASIQVSRTMIAFESSSSLVTSDVGMKVLKGESLGASLQGKIGELAKGVNSASNSIASSAPAMKGADIPADADLSDFEMLTTKDFPTAQSIASKVSDSAGVSTASAKIAAPVQSAEIAQLADEAGQFVASNEEVSTSRKTVSDVVPDKVLKDVKAVDLFSVKPQGGENSEIVQFETAEGEVADLDNIDEALDNVMDIAARKTSLESRVEGFSRQAMVKLSTVTSQVDIQMRQLANQGGGQVKFRLDPPELGEIDINLKISKGQVKGTIIVQSIEAAEQLARDLRSLQQSLQDAGLNLSEEGLQFKLRDEQPNPDQQQSQHGSGEGREGGTASTSIAADTQEESTGWVKPDAILDVSV